MRSRRIPIVRTARSRLPVSALKNCIQRRQNLELLARLNAAYADEPTPEELTLLRKARESYARHLKGEW